MTAWTSEELDRIGNAQLLRVAPRRADGTLGSPRTIWVVRHGDGLYVRSVRGPAGAWYRAVLARREGHIAAGGVDRDVSFADVAGVSSDQLDAAYRAKYGESPHVDSMLSPPVRQTSLQLVPR